MLPAFSSSSFFFVLVFVSILFRDGDTGLLFHGGALLLPRFSRTTLVVGWWNHRTRWTRLPLRCQCTTMQQLPLTRQDQLVDHRSQHQGEHHTRLPEGVVLPSSPHRRKRRSDIKRQTMDECGRRGARTHRMRGTRRRSGWGWF